MLVTKKELKKIIDEQQKMQNNFFREVANLEIEVSFTKECVEDLEEKIESLKTTIDCLSNIVMDLKENTNRVNDNEKNRKSKILNDIKAVQEYSLADALNYLKGE